MTVAATLGESRDIAYARAASTPIFLGSYRLLLAFFVFSAHAVWPLAQTVTRAEIGPIGVLCFFIVSGFLITLTIEAHYTESIRRFLLNRFLRIYPTFWVSMIVAALAILATGTTYVTANFYLRGWTWDNILRCILIVPATGGNDTWGPIPIGWTLQIEVSFYLAMALLYLVIGRLAQATRHIVMMFFCFGCLVAYGVMIATTTVGWFNALYVPFFAAGVMAAVISRLKPTQHAMRLFGGAVLAVALALCIYVVFSCGP